MAAPCRRPDAREHALFQSEYLAGAQQANRLLQASGLRFLALGRFDPGEISAALFRYKRFKMALCSRMGPQRREHVRWKLRRQFQPSWSLTIAPVSGGPTKTGGLQPPARLECRVSLPVRVRPSAVRSPRREL